MNEFISRHQVSELVGTPKLNSAVVMLIQMIKIVGLKDLIGELGQTHTLCAFQAGLHAVSAEQSPHAEMPTNRGQELNHILASVPGGVVQDIHRPEWLFGVAWRIQFMISKNTLETVPYPSGILFYALLREWLSLCCLSARVSDPGSGSPNQCNGIVTGASEMKEPDDGQKVAHMQTLSCGVKAAVDSLRA